jgi:hypothetical protein
MLLPALSKAREKARTISCVNNMKQSLLAITIYLNDNEGFIYYTHSNADYNGWGFTLKTTGYSESAKGLKCPVTPTYSAENFHSIFGMLSGSGKDGWGAPGASNFYINVLPASAYSNSTGVGSINYWHGQLKPGTPVLADSITHWSAQSTFKGMQYSNCGIFWGNSGGGQVYPAHGMKVNIGSLDGSAGTFAVNEAAAKFKNDGAGCTAASIEFWYADNNRYPAYP